MNNYDAKNDFYDAKNNYMEMFVNISTRSMS